MAVSFSDPMPAHVPAVNRRSGQVAAASSRGGSSGSDSCFDLELCPDLILAGFAAFGAAAFFFLYQAITMAGKRKKRSLGTFPLLLKALPSLTM